MTIDEIRREVEASRAAIHRDYAAFRSELDFVGKAKRSVVRKPLQWLGGAAAVGYFLSGRRSKKARRRKDGAAQAAESAKQITVLGVLIAAVRLVFPILQPMLTAFAARKVGDFAAKRF